MAMASWGLPILERIIPNTATPPEISKLSNPQNAEEYKRTCILEPLDSRILQAKVRIFSHDEEGEEEDTTVSSAFS
jgi:hypothetical protein